LTRGIKPSLYARISYVQRRLGHILDSSWFFVASLFSKRNTPLIKDEGRPLQRTPYIEQELLLPRKESRFVGSHKLLLEVLGGMATILTLTGFYLSYLAPKLSVDVSGSLQTANPMRTVFNLSNDGALPIHDIIVLCGEVQLNAGNFQVESGQDSGFIFPDSKANILSPGHTMALPCNRIFGTPNPDTITSAEMTIIVKYRPDWIPWHRAEKFPWKAEKADTGWIWKSLAH